MPILQFFKNKEQWEAHLSNGENKIFPTLGAFQIEELQDWLLQNKVIGGCFSEKVFFQQNKKIIALDQYLTENLNQPFIIGEKQDWQQKSREIPWKLTYEGYNPGKDEYAVESLLTVGNGFLGIRGTTPEMTIGEANYPGIYLAGLYNTAESQVGTETISNEDFVNIPNLQKMTLLIDGQTIDIATNELLAMTRELDLKTGLFQSWVTLALPDGKQIAIHTKRFASMADIHQVHLSYTFKPLNFSGTLTLVSELDGAVYNYNVERYRTLTNRHLTILDLHAKNQAFMLTTQTKQSKITIQQQGVLRSPTTALDQLTIEKTTDCMQQLLPLMVTKGQSYTFEKAITIEQYPKTSAIPPFKWKDDFPTFDEAYEKSSKEWQKLWDKAAIQIEGDLMSQKLLNLHTYHLLASCSPNGNKNLDASVTARGLHGEAYRGHIFWDELFILPFYLVHFPETARQLLLYRYHRLGQAKINAQEAGYSGAMFPWQSGLDGSEQSQKIHLNPVSGEWKEDHSRLQRHVSLAIAYNVWQYWSQTKDVAFMVDYGLEMLLEIAHFWQSVTTYDSKRQRYSITKVMGPDEFHEAYPDTQEGGLKDNAYTNMMVVWLFETIETLHETFDPILFQTVLAKINAPTTFLQKIDKIKHQLHLEINDAGVIAQYEGYFDLKELDWDAYREKYPNIYRMDRILNAEGFSANDYQAAKQADTLMIFYNFAKEQVDQILIDLNYHLPKDYVEQNLNYYLARTTHGSTLSRIVHAQLAAMVEDQDLAWQLYEEALYSDYRDIQGGTTAEGIHAGVMAATLWIPLSTFAGLDLRQGNLVFRPKLPKHWKSIAFHFTWQQTDFYVLVTPETLNITSTKACQINVFEQIVHLEKDQAMNITY